MSFTEHLPKNSHFNVFMFTHDAKCIKSTEGSNLLSRQVEDGNGS